ncbi:MAG: excinuclease ABC subunit UvrA [Sphaerochaetaceae bacterium]
MNDKLIIRGAREHNLKNINLELEKNKLIVISGLSGSGKSSLAFDTIFAEGQRRYVESLSSYARQFLGRLDKPDVDYIEGLSPSIAIQQKSTNRNPRSTVGTITEIYDYYRLLWARIGIVHCPNGHGEISKVTVDQVIDKVFEKEEGTKLYILAPVVLGRKGEYRKVFEDAKKLGFQRAKVDSEIVNLTDMVNLEKNLKHSISIITDRLILKKDNRQRLAESMETSVTLSKGLIEIGEISEDGNVQYQIFSLKNSCPHCGASIGELQPRNFSFNSPFGACPNCKGLGTTVRFDPDKIIPDRSLSFNKGGIACQNPDSKWGRATFEALSKKYHFSLDTPFEKLDDEIIKIILYGSQDKIRLERGSLENSSYFFSTDRKFPGIINDLKRRYASTDSPYIRNWLQGFQTENLCPVCNGNKLKPEILGVTVGDLNIIEATNLSVKASVDFFSKLELDSSKKEIAKEILKEINNRLNFLCNVGLDYLTLSRKAGTLSGGEAQRIRLATQIGSALTGVIYVLDEPSIGLHQRDNQRLIDSLKNLRNIGNSVIVVEHDEQTIREADYLVDLGPAAGVNGGYIVAEGTPEQVKLNPDSITGKYLRGELAIPVPLKRRKGNGKFIKLEGAERNNLKKINVKFPLGEFIALTGVSGSGKSTLLNGILLPAVKQQLLQKKGKVKYLKKITGLENVDKVINIDQSPIGRTPKSNPATYVGLFAPIRELFASLTESKARGYKPGRFSFNVNGGRCEACKGDGTIKVAMNFLPDVYVKCDVCNGKRYNEETLGIYYKGKNIHDVLEMTVAQAYEFFEPIKKISTKLKTLIEVGLDYIKLGQSALTLSGGEAQRVKLSLELSKRSTGKTLYILDEPTTGLHAGDVKKLLEVLNRLVDSGNTVILIEHNLDVIKQVDYIIDLGPEGGIEGGTVVAEGTPEKISRNKNSYTGYYLKETLK